MAKRGSTERRRERTSSAPARPSTPNLAPLTRAVPLAGDERANERDDATTQPRMQRSNNPIAQPSELARDERETHLLDEFFSWPPPQVEYPPPRFEPPRMSRASRRAMWATFTMLTVSFLGFGGFLAYHDLIVPTPAELSDLDAPQSIELPTPILADDRLVEAEPVRTNLRARLARIEDLMREAQETEAAQQADQEAEQAPPSSDTHAQPAAADEPASSEGESFDELVAAARKLAEQGDATHALLVYNRALAPRPQAIEALLGKAAALFALADYDAAKSTAEQAVALDPHSRDGLLLIGSTWEQLGNKDAAKDAYQRCVDDNESQAAPCRKRLVELDAKP